MGLGQGWVPVHMSTLGWDGVGAMTAGTGWSWGKFLNRNVGLGINYAEMGGDGDHLVTPCVQASISEYIIVSFHRPNPGGWIVGSCTKSQFTTEAKLQSPCH